MQDKLFRELNVNDQVLYVAAHYPGNLETRIGKVINFSEHKVRVSWYRLVDGKLVNANNETSVNSASLIKLQSFEEVK